MDGQSAVGQSWFVVRGEHTEGPFEISQMIAAALDGRLNREDLVWTEGMAGWEPAGTVSTIFSVPPPLPQSATPTSSAENVIFNELNEDKLKDEISHPAEQSPEEFAQQAKFQATTETAKSSNFFLRHWKGELSLPVSYWLVGVGASIVAVVLGKFVGDLGETIRDPRFVGAIIIAFLCFLLVITVWQLVGVWRSAGRSIKRGRYFWPSAARLMVIIGVFGLVANLASVTGPMLQASYRLVTVGEEIPPARIVYDEQLKAVKLTGGMPYGTSDKLEAVLDATSKSGLLVLDSIGGNLNEGIRINKLIRNRGLAVATLQQCLSACTLAFLGGKTRYLASAGRLGFHSAAFGAVDNASLPEINEQVRKIFSKEGIPSWFITKAVRTPSDSMWYPTKAELVQAQILPKATNWDSVFNPLVNHELKAALRASSESLNKSLPKKLDGITILTHTNTTELNAVI